MTQFVRHYLLALQFFTRIPVTGRLADWVGFSPAMLRASAAHFPGCGLAGGRAGGRVRGLLLLLARRRLLRPGGGGAGHRAQRADDRRVS